MDAENVADGVYFAYVLSSELPSLSYGDDVTADIDSDSDVGGSPYFWTDNTRNFALILGMCGFPLWVMCVRER